MTLPKITKKQQEILELLYRYRFLDRIQVQSLMGHKDRKTINLWLRDLRAKHYVEWIYSTHFLEKTKPAIYYLGINGIRSLKQQNSTGDDEESESYPLEELRKRYREAYRSQTFIARCRLIADCCITLQQDNQDTSSSDPTTAYFYETEADYLRDSYYHFLTESKLIHPQLCFSEDEYDAAAKEYVTFQSYLLEIFDVTLPRYRIKKRLTDYVNYLEAGAWEAETGDDAPPIILLVCSRLTDLIYAKRRTRGLLAHVRDEHDRKHMHIHFTTMDNLKAHGVTGEIWEEA